MDEIQESKKKTTRVYKIYSRIKRKLLSRYMWLVRLFFFALIGFAVGVFIAISKPIFVKSGASQVTSLVNHFLFTPEGSVKSFGGRTNILILGKAGEGHIAPDLTDTIMVVSVNHKNPQDIKLISLPRDIWIAELRAKLNSAYYWGNQKRQDGGLVLAKSSVEQILGLPVHYALVVDFSSFIEVIDVLDGISVDVEKGFVDEKFPVPGRETDECDGDPEYNCRYESIEFVRGLQIMDGDTALKFVRSRQSEDLEEGTDLARAERQQRVISAIKTKTLSPDTFLSIKKLKSLYKIAIENIETDMSGQEMASLSRRLLQARDKTSTLTIPEEMLINPPISATYDYLYVFIPEGEDWSLIHSWLRGRL